MNAIQEGFQEVYQLAWPVEAGGEDAHSSLCMVIMKREGGVLLAVPSGFIPPEALQLASSHDGGALLGPHTVLSVPGVLLDGDVSHTTGEDLDVQVVDASLAILDGPLSHARWRGRGGCGNHSFFYRASSCARPSHAPEVCKGVAGGSRARQVSVLLCGRGVRAGGPSQCGRKGGQGQGPKGKGSRKGKKGVSSTGCGADPTLVQDDAHHHDRSEFNSRGAEAASTGCGGRSNVSPSSAYASASLDEHAAVCQVDGAASESARDCPGPSASKDLAQMPAAAMNLDVAGQEEGQQVEEEEALGRGESLALAVLEQSRALTSLVTHIQAGGDPLLDHHLTGVSSTTKGAQGREKLQQELAARSGGFCLAVAQNAFKRLRPASRVPNTMEEISATDFSMLTYLERFGGYGNSRDLGLMQCFVLDCAIREI